MNKKEIRNILVLGATVGLGHYDDNYTDDLILKENVKDYNNTTQGY